MNPDKHNAGLTAQQREPWLEQAINELKQPLPADVAGQLRTARRKALAGQGQAVAKKSPFALFKWPSLWAVPMPVAAMGAAAAVLAVMLVVGLIGQPQQSGQVQQWADYKKDTQLDDLAIIQAQDDLQFYQDLEFLLWLEEQANEATPS